MKDKIQGIIKKTVDFLKNNVILSICCAAALAVVIIVIVLVSASGGDDDKKNFDGKWGDGITENIPEFDGKCDSLQNDEDVYCVAYYSEVTGEEVAEYISEIENECDVKFEGSKYPRSAVCGDKIIVIHYNVTEMKFSVTVVSKTVNT